MGFYGDKIVPYCVELGCGTKALIPDRRKVVADLHGTVLEIGFGSGLNVPHLPQTVTRLLAVDPSERARGIGHKRIAAAHCPIRFIGRDAERIQTEDASADAALCTFTLCTIPEAERALREVRRVLKPNGRLHFLEHGRAPDASVARWQDRLNGMQKVLAGGCHLNRDIPALLQGAGFLVQSLEAAYHPKLPRTHGYLYRGSALAV